jgi:hypothetical protein
MKTIKIIAFVLGSAFAVNCGVDSSSSEPRTDVDEQFVLPSCEGRDGQRCTQKGPAGQCDNGTEEPGFCFCAQHNADPFRLVCG